MDQNQLRPYLNQCSRLLQEHQLPTPKPITPNVLSFDFFSNKLFLPASTNLEFDHLAASNSFVHSTPANKLREEAIIVG